MGGEGWAPLARPCPALVHTWTKAHSLLQEARALADHFRFWAPTGRATNVHSYRH